MPQDKNLIIAKSNSKRKSYQNFKNIFLAIGDT